MYTALGAYIFAGGFTLGVADQFDVVAHLEDGEFGVRTFSANFPSIPVHTELAKWPVERFRGVDFVFANPPCIGWSSIGRSWRLGADAWRKDPRVSCTRVVAGLLKDIQPRVWAFESVQNLLTRGAEVVTDITDLATGLGYHVYYALHDPKFMGLAQQRRRVFVVASRVKIDWQSPLGVIVPSKVVFDEVEDPGHFFPVSEAHLHFVKDLKPGQGSLAAYEKLYPELASAVTRAKGIKGVKGRPRFMDHRLDPELPCTTIVGMTPPAQIHPHEHRYLGTNEVARFCGFPEGWAWTGTHFDTYLETARGVTSTAGRWLADNVRAALEKNESVEPGATWVDYSGEKKTRKCTTMAARIISPYTLYQTPRMEVA